MNMVPWYSLVGHQIEGPGMVCGALATAACNTPGYVVWWWYGGDSSHLALDTRILGLHPR
jgi:hypothetical protein